MALEARLLSQANGSTDNSDNSPGEVALLQASVHRLTADLEEMKLSRGQKESEILNLRMKLEGSQQEIAHLVRIKLEWIHFWSFLVQGF